MPLEEALADMFAYDYDRQQVTDAFWLRAQEIYGSAVAGSAASAFGAVGLRPSIFDPCLGLPRPSPKCPR